MSEPHRQGPVWHDGIVTRSARVRLLDALPELIAGAATVLAAILSVRSALS